MIVKEVMQKEVLSCTPASDLSEVANTMRDHNCGFLPVVDSHGAVVGVVTDRDVCLAVTSKRTPAHIAASEIMSHPVFGCFPDENVKTALATMSKHHVRRLPVFEKEHGHLQGVLSVDDVLQMPRRRGSPTNDDIAQALRMIGAHRVVESVPA